MSSATSLSRSRSLRKPATAGDSSGGSSSESRQRDVTAPVSSRGDARNVSPSRLPVKPPARSASTNTAAGAASATGAKNRPMSGLMGRPLSARQGKEGATQPEPTKRYPPSASSSRPTAPMSRPTSSGGVQISRPTSSGGLPSAAAKPRVPTHSRAKSTVTTLTNSTILRPPSQGSTSSGGVTAARARPPSRGTTAASQASQAQTRLRPAFTTLQQHYSPAKSLAPKPLTSTFLAPPSPSKLPANIALSAETSKLQTELLQLHLLHRDAASVDAAWRASAREKLGERFTNLGRQSAALSRAEMGRIERLNVLAVKEWAAQGGQGLEEKVQMLDSTLASLWSLGEPGGKYTRVVRRFERWVERMCEVEEARRRGDGSGMMEGGEVVFVGELDSAWRDECGGLQRRLEGWQRQLEEMGVLPSKDGMDTTSLARMLDGCQRLVHDMLAELDVMGHIERDVVRKENEWIRRMNQEEKGDDTPRAGAIWRAL